MGCVQQAVVEFDEEVRAPWRPRLVAVAAVEAPSDERPSEATLQARPSRRDPSRVGSCRPTVSTGSGAVSGRGGRVVSDGALSPTPDVRPGRGSRPVGGRRPSPRLRLTRRARRFALVLALGAGVALGSWLAPLFGADSGSGLRMAGVTSVVVRPGDTLWSIASPVAGDGDLRATVAEIRRLNGLSSARLVPGQTLQLP